MATKTKRNTREMVEFKRAMLDVISETLERLDSSDSYTRSNMDDNAALLAQYRADNPNATERDDWTLRNYVNDDRRYHSMLEATAEVRALLETLI